jgi:tRNA G46 methylase TrmB
VFINFPEPPHSEDISSALINEDLLRQIHRILAPRGELSIASDDVVYIKSISEAIRAMGSSMFKSSIEGSRDGVTSDFTGYGASFFDKLWEARGRSDRRLLKVYKRKKSNV